MDNNENGNIFEPNNSNTDLTTQQSNDTNNSYDNEFHYGQRSKLKTALIVAGVLLGLAFLGSISNLYADFTVMDFLSSLIFTVSIATLPIIIYRYAIKKGPINKKKAIIITVVYFILSSIAMGALLLALGVGNSGKVAIIWPFINYYMLTASTDKDKN